MLIAPALLWLACAFTVTEAVRVKSSRKHHRWKNEDGTSKYPLQHKDAKNRGYKSVHQRRMYPVQERPHGKHSDVASFVPEEFEPQNTGGRSNKASNKNVNSPRDLSRASNKHRKVGKHRSRKRQRQKKPIRVQEGPEVSLDGVASLVPDNMDSARADGQSPKVPPTNDSPNINQPDIEKKVCVKSVQATEPPRHQEPILKRNLLSYRQPLSAPKTAPFRDIHDQMTLINAFTPDSFFWKPSSHRPMSLVNQIKHHQDSSFLYKILKEQPRWAAPSMHIQPPRFPRVSQHNQSELLKESDSAMNYDPCLKLTVKDPYAQKFNQDARIHDSDIRGERKKEAEEFDQGQRLLLRQLITKDGFEPICLRMLSRDPSDNKAQGINSANTEAVHSRFQSKEIPESEHLCLLIPADDPVHFRSRHQRSSRNSERLDIMTPLMSQMILKTPMNASSSQFMSSVPRMKIGDLQEYLNTAPKGHNNSIASLGDFEKNSNIFKNETAVDCLMKEHHNFFGTCNTTSFKFNPQYIFPFASYIYDSLGLLHHQDPSNISTSVISNNSSINDLQDNGSNISSGNTCLIDGNPPSALSDDSSSKGVTDHFYPEEVNAHYSTKPPALLNNSTPLNKTNNFLESDEKLSNKNISSEITTIETNTVPIDSANICPESSLHSDAESCTDSLKYNSRSLIQRLSDSISLIAANTSHEILKNINEQEKNILEEKTFNKTTEEVTTDRKLEATSTLLSTERKSVPDSVKFDFKDIANTSFSKILKEGTNGEFGLAFMYSSIQEVTTLKNYVFQDDKDVEVGNITYKVETSEKSAAAIDKREKTNDYKSSPENSIHLGCNGTIRAENTEDISGNFRLSTEEIFIINERPSNKGLSTKFDLEDIAVVTESYKETSRTSLPLLYIDNPGDALNLNDSGKNMFDQNIEVCSEDSHNKTTDKHQYSPFPYETLILFGQNRTTDVAYPLNLCATTPVEHFETTQGETNSKRKMKMRYTIGKFNVRLNSGVMSSISRMSCQINMSADDSTDRNQNYSNGNPICPDVLDSVNLQKTNLIPPSSLDPADFYSESRIFPEGNSSAIENDKLNSNYQGDPALLMDAVSDRGSTGSTPMPFSRSFSLYTSEATILRGDSLVGSLFRNKGKFRPSGRHYFHGQNPLKKFPQEVTTYLTANSKKLVNMKSASVKSLDETNRTISGHRKPEKVHEPEDKPIFRNEVELKDDQVLISTEGQEIITAPEILDAFPDIKDSSEIPETTPYVESDDTTEPIADSEVSSRPARDIFYTYPRATTVSVNLRDLPEFIPQLPRRSMPKTLGVPIPPNLSEDEIKMHIRITTFRPNILYPV